MNAKRATRTNLALQQAREELAHTFVLSDPSSKNVLVEGRVMLGVNGEGAADGAASDSRLPLPVSRTCFACGTDNDLGLRARLGFDDDTVGATWEPRPPFRRADGTLAPAALTTLLDEAAFWLGALATGESGMTTELRVSLHRPAPFGAVITVICFFLQVPIYLCPVFGTAVGYLGGRFWLGRKRKKHQNAYLDELPNAVEAIVRGVKSGLPLNDSMRLVSKEAKEPIKSEFARVIDQQALGKSTTEAIQMLFERMPLPEVNFFVVVISVQQQAGGNLSEALGNLSKVLRNRKKMKQKIKAMSSEAKASAGIIGSLPFIVAILVTLTTPSYMVPLFTTQIGLIWLGIAVILMSIGGFMMNRMIQFDF